MITLKYIGPFLKVAVDGIEFVRHSPVSVPEELAQRLLAAQCLGEPLFVEA